MRKNRKTSVILGTTLLITAALSAFAGCGGESVPPVPEDPKDDTPPVSGVSVRLTEKEDSLTMENGTISLTVDKRNGSITDVTHLGKGVGLVHDGGANFSVKIDPTTDDVFKANHQSKSAILLQSKDFTPLIDTEIEDDRGTIALTYHLSYQYKSETVSGLMVKNTISLDKDSSYFTSDYEIVNNAPSGVVVTLTGAQLSGIRNESGAPWSLYYPEKEGKLFDDVITLGKKVKAGYPSPMSVQLLQVYNGNVSFDLSVLDTEGVYKEFCFGRFVSEGDYDEGRELGYQTSMACTQFPFVKAGERAEVSPYRIGTGGEGSWYEGADRYREFLISSGMTKEKNELTAEWTGMLPYSAMTSKQVVNATYLGGNGKPSYAEIIDVAEEIGVTMLDAHGWHTGGFDQMYPDYEFSAEQGGEEAFGQMVQTLKGNGKQIVCYINAHIADINSNWSHTMSKSDPSLTKIRECATKKVGFEYGVTAPADYERYMYYEPYTDLSAYAMSPASEEFYEAIVGAVERLAAKGVDGIWFDQLMEMPCYLDYDSSHGAKNPATAYSEGYRRLLTKVCDIMDKATGGKSLFVCEGICDAYIRYIDVCGLMWARKFGAADADGSSWSPRITRYTIPSAVLGMPTADETAGSLIEFGQAFIYGDPLLTRTDTRSYPGMKTILDTYRAEKNIYFYGRFMDTRGLTLSENFVMSSVIVGSDGTVGIQLLNERAVDCRSLEISLDLAALGLDGSVATVTNMQTGESVALTAENKFTVALKGRSLASYKITVSE